MGPGDLVLLGFAALQPGQLVIDVSPQAGPQHKAHQQNEDQQHHEWVRARANPQPGGHAGEAAPEQVASTEPRSSRSQPPKPARPGQPAWRTDHRSGLRL